MTKYRITRSWPKQSLQSRAVDHDSMTAAYLYMIEQARLALQVRRAYDMLWLSDEEMALTSPTGRIIELFTLSMEEVADDPATTPHA